MLLNSSSAVRPRVGGGGLEARSIGTLEICPRVFHGYSSTVVSDGWFALLGQDGKLVLQNLGKVLLKGWESKARDYLAYKRHDDGDTVLWCYFWDACDNMSCTQWNPFSHATNDNVDCRCGKVDVCSSSRAGPIVHVSLKVGRTNIGGLRDSLTETFTVQGSNKMSRMVQASLSDS